jgi:two-component sensor histidine kinase
VETLGSKIIDGLVRQMGGKLSTDGEDGVRTMVLFDRASAA